jgi:hypothetical protein
LEGSNEPDDAAKFKLNSNYPIFLHPISHDGKEMFESSLQNAEIISNSGYIPTAVIVINGDSRNFRDMSIALDNQMHVILVSVI